ncbi:ATP-binding cassette domain-containing protein [bacterium]|nr:ATP-binding cassette domain-containing protein [bacterium]
MIKVNNVTAAYPGNVSNFSLKGISFDFKPGERLALMGCNGSGKTTLIHAILGLMPLKLGTITVDDYKVGPHENLFEVRRRVGLMFQNPDNQMVATTVERELAFGLENLAVPPEEMFYRVNAALDRFNLRAYATKEPHLLSGGERQRLALAAIWVMHPRYLILDEPTSLLDPGNKREVLRLLDEEMGGRSMGIMLITQLPDEVVDCDRVLILHDGKLVFDGPPDIVFKNRQQLVDFGIDIPTKMKIEQMLDGYSDPF